MVCTFRLRFTSVSPGPTPRQVSPRRSLPTSAMRLSTPSTHRGRRRAAERFTASEERPTATRSSTPSSPLRSTQCMTWLRTRLARKVSGQPWFLAIDLGTGGPKTGAVSLNGDLLGKNLGSVQTRYLHDGGAVQDTSEWWSHIRDGVRSLIDSRVADPADLAGVGITGQWGSTVPVGADGVAVS